ncbi:hypothetical protein [Streptomyces roseolilacinus]|uniref:hypothetical protein n=1 Tax=Streptomyces roseolilacinus TaxID=66904 RepID=UPI003810FA8E
MRITASSSLGARWTATAVAVSCLLSVGGTTSTAHAFSGENHEKITRKALSSWEPKSLKSMAFQGATLFSDHGAIIANDKGDYFQDGTLHCDNADYLAPKYAQRYPRTREQANDEIIACVRGALSRFNKAVAAADRLVDAQGKVLPKQVNLNSPCNWNDQPGRAKCDVYEHLGRAWHPIEDFYAHSNWTDSPHPYEIGVYNPPGLNRQTLPEFFSLHRYSSMSEQRWVKDATRHIPNDLSTGCYPNKDSTGHVSNCNGRILHDGALSKDTLGDRRSGIHSNFSNASDMAIKDIERQWRDFKDALRKRYNDRAAPMICALTHDNPATKCN